MKLPNAITRQLRKISFKTKDSLLRHVLGLLASWNYAQGNPYTWRKRDQRSASLMGQGTGLQRNHARHAESCRQGYLAKIALVDAGKGRNTLCGIPA